MLQSVECIHMALLSARGHKFYRYTFQPEASSSFARLPSIIVHQSLEARSTPTWGQRPCSFIPKITCCYRGQPVNARTKVIDVGFVRLRECCRICTSVTC